MRVSRRLCVALSLCLMPAAAWGLAPVYPDVGYRPPSDWTEATFSLSQAYPASAPTASKRPWASIDPATDPEKYLWAVINYAYEGNVDKDFVVQKNTVRPWFHAPWLHWGPRGREFVRGLTGERGSRPFELAATQTTAQRNYAVGFYNAEGGYTIGQVWKDPATPDAAAASFPEGTVSFKLLFTTTPATQASWLAGSPEWVADIDRSPNAAGVKANKVRLLQIDIAVKDSRSKKGGWIFGTFHYDSAVSDPVPWRRLRALSLAWGDDPGITPGKIAAGEKLKESWINANSPIVQYRAKPPTGVTPPPTLGWAGRANGPVDNPISSCLSCHGTAQLPAAVNMTPPGGASDTTRLNWFRNLGPGEAFTSTSKSLDYSLQLGVGIQNHADFVTFVKDQGGFFLKPPTAAPGLEAAPAAPKEFRFSRDTD